MNVYEKIQKVKMELMLTKIKKSGENKFSGFKYFELADFLPTIIRLCNEEGLFTAISFDQNLAYLQITNVEEPQETLRYTSPMKDLELKGCNSVQALGGTETYSRRYLYMAAFDIVESDMFDANAGSEKNEEVINVTKQEALKQSITNNKISNEDVNEVLDKYGYEDISEITIGDYMKIANELKKRSSK